MMYVRMPAITSVDRLSHSRPLSADRLYHGLHSLDPAWLRSRHPLWDVLVVALSLGGIVGVAASLVPTWRRIRGVWRQA